MKKAILMASFTAAALFAYNTPVWSKVQRNTTPPTVSGSQKQEAIESEKERIGGDVPLACWRESSVTPSLVILCLHGFGLNKNSYQQAGRRLAALGIVTYALDVRGFGSWLKTEECQQLDLEAALADVKSALRAIHAAHPHLPVVLLGESMGGALALQAAAANQDLVDGLISSVPSGDRFGQPVTDLKVAFAMLSKKQVTVGNTLAKKITRNAALRTRLVEDDGARTKASARELLSFQSFMNHTPAKAKLISHMPVLILQGGSDRLVKPAGTEQIFRLLTTKDKSLVLVGTSEHLILEDGQFSDDIIDTVASWLLKHVAAQTRKGNAEKILDALDKDQQLNEAIGHYRFGQGFVKFKEFAKAREELSKAMRLARGTPLTRVCLNAMLTLPQQTLAPPTTLDGDKLTNEIKLATVAQAFANDQPSVIFFGANWIDSCRVTSSMLDHLMPRFATKINYVKVDADDPKNEALCKRYDINPLPAILFLNAGNDVVSYAIGAIDDSTLRQEIAKILTDDQKAQLTQP